MNNKKEIIEGLKNILREIRVKYFDILLFGSRAREDFDEQSDWDFFIILAQDLKLKERKKLRYKIYREFHKYFPLIPVDIILKDKITFENEKNIANTISNEVYLEGIKV